MSFLFLLGLSVLIGIIRWIGWREISPLFLFFSGWEGGAKILIIFCLTILMIFCGMLKWKMILDTRNHHISFFELFKLYLGGFFVTQLFPVILFGGEGVRGVILKKKHFLSWREAISSVVIDRVLQLTSYLITILLGCGFLFWKVGFSFKKAEFFLGGFTFLLLVGASFFYFKSFKKQSIIERFLKSFNFKNNNQEPLKTEKEILDFFNFKNLLFWKGLGLAFLRVIVTAIRTFILLLFLGKKITTTAVISVTGFYYFSLLLPIPLALGSHEAIQAMVFQGFNLGANTAVVFTLIQRGVEFLVALIGMFILLPYLSYFFFKIPKLSNDR